MTRVVAQNGTTNTYNTSFINNPVTGQPLIQITHTGAVNMYVYSGTNGASIELLASNGNVALAERYDPYGVPIIAQGYGSDAHEENPYDFDGGGVEMRQTGWIHMGGRYLSPLTGTFTQQDNLDVPLDPANANRYAYAAGDPINKVDPSGGSLKSKIGDAASAVVEAATAASGGTLIGAGSAEYGGGTLAAAGFGALGVATGRAILVAGGLAIAYYYQSR